MKKFIVKSLEFTKLDKKQIEDLLEVPPNQEMGDFAFPCFILAKEMKKSPIEIAKELKSKIKISSPVEKVEVNGPYLNFFIDRKIFAKDLVKEILDKKENFGKSKIGKGEKVIVEFSSPNIAKPFGIGHLRSTIIGNSIANIEEFVGYKAVRMNYLGDWGTQFGKMIVGYKNWGDESKLKKDSIKHLLELYVKANDEKYENEAREWFKKLEDGDKEALDLWKRFRDLSLEEFKKIYDLFNIKFDDFSGESKYNEEMKEVLNELKEKNLLELNQGAQVVNLEKEKLGIALIQKTDGSTLYITRDLASAISRYNKYKPKKLLYEVGQEQSLHFNQVFEILKKMGYAWAKDCKHIGHGLYLDKDGKKFSTRKGKTVFMQDIIDETVDLAKKEIKSRAQDLNEKELEERAVKVAIAAIFYGDLKSGRQNNIVFDLERFVSFEGDTGPYLLYSYARANSILKKIKKVKENLEIKNLEEKEVELIKKLGNFKEIVLRADKELMPSLIANYAYQLSKIFNEFYHACPVLNSEQEGFRISLVKSFMIVLKSSLELLGIETIEEM